MVHVYRMCLARPVDVVELRVSNIRLKWGCMEKLFMRAVYGSLTF